MSHSLLSLRRLQFSSLGKIWPAHAVSWAENARCFTSVKVVQIMTLSHGAVSIPIEEFGVLETEHTAV